MDCSSFIRARSSFSFSVSFFFSPFLPTRVGAGARARAPRARCCRRRRRRRRRRAGAVAVARRRHRERRRAQARRRRRRVEAARHQVGLLDREHLLLAAAARVARSPSPITSKPCGGVGARRAHALHRALRRRERHRPPRDWEALGRRRHPREALEPAVRRRCELVLRVDPRPRTAAERVVVHRIARRAHLRRTRGARPDVDEEYGRGAPPAQSSSVSSGCGKLAATRLLHGAAEAGDPRAHYELCRPGARLNPTAAPSAPTPCSPSRRSSRSASMSASSARTPSSSPRAPPTPGAATRRGARRRRRPPPPRPRACAAPRRPAPRRRARPSRRAPRGPTPRRARRRAPALARERRLGRRPALCRRLGGDERAPRRPLGRGDRAVVAPHGGGGGEGGGVALHPHRLQQLVLLEHRAKLALERRLPLVQLLQRRAVWRCSSAPRRLSDSSAFR